MDPDERAKYDKMARDDKARYDLEKASYTAPPGGSVAKKRDPNAPKRPMSAYRKFEPVVLFCRVVLGNLIQLVVLQLPSQMPDGRKRSSRTQILRTVRSARY